MNPQFPFHTIVPTFFAGLIDDPVLLLRTRADGHHLMFDCGQIHHLAKRTFTHLDAVFISHAHMDHWMGIDSVIRQLIAANKTVDIYGGPGMVARFEHKLKGYDWNLAEPYWSSFHVHELVKDRIRSCRFAGEDGFRSVAQNDRTRNGLPLYSNDTLDVYAATCNHRVDSIIYRVNERPAPRIDKAKLKEMGLRPGDWLSDLKHCLAKGQSYPDYLRIMVLEYDREIIVEDIQGLADQIVIFGPSHAIGYVSDVGFSRENRKTIAAMMAGVDLLCCECTFLQDGKDRARASWHLCTEDINALLAEIKPQFFLPMHLSRSYSRRHMDLYREIRPPQGTTVLELPLQLTPRPLTAEEVRWQTVDL